ncbi:MAG TPA: pyridoxal phosphate-dependent aminotransferase [Ktedonobacterales bacterium]|nr:pyridoxal phosphate-dependent aminotransferase [Ktedonobacterales bacterium]
MARINLGISSQPPNPMFRLGALVHGRADIIHLEFGEPDFPTPAHIVEAAARSLRDERQGYGPGNGMPWLRAEVAARAGRVNGLTVAPESVVVTTGGTGALMASLLCLTTPGDDALVPEPAWAGYDAMLAAANVRMIRYPLRADQGWQPDLDALEAAVTPRTSVLLINSPSNPGGAVFPRATMERIVDLCRRKDLWLLSDECYDELVFDGQHVSPASLDGNDGRVLTVGTCSKSYAMTGWRVGWVIAPPAVAPALALTVTAQVNNLPLFVQRAAEAALASPPTVVREMAAAYRGRRNAAVETLRQRSLLEYIPAGAFYLLAQIAGDDEAALNGVAFAEALIRERSIAVAPGIAFGPATARYARISLASDTESVRVGLAGLLDFAATYRDRAGG